MNHKTANIKTIPANSSFLQKKVLRSQNHSNQALKLVQFQKFHRIVFVSAFQFLDMYI